MAPQPPSVFLVQFLCAFVGGVGGGGGGVLRKKCCLLGQSPITTSWIGGVHLPRNQYNVIMKDA